MSVERQYFARPTIPAIRVHSASPVPFDHINPTSLKVTVATIEGLGQPKYAATCPRENKTSSQSRKTSSTATELDTFETPAKTTSAKMARYDSESSSSSASSKKHAASLSSRKSKPSPKDVDWTDVTDPEERRRIQNRIAQRKFSKCVAASVRRMGNY